MTNAIVSSVRADSQPRKTTYQQKLHAEHQERQARWRWQAGEAERAQRAAERKHEHARQEALRAALLAKAKEAEDAALAVVAAKVSLTRAAEPITAREIIAVTAAHYGLTVQALLSRKRYPEIVIPRMVAIYLTRELTTSYSLPTIGCAFDKRDHSTILHSIRKIKTLLPEDQAIAAMIQKITDEIHRRHT